MIISSNQSSYQNSHQLILFILCLRFLSAPWFPSRKAAVFACGSRFLPAANLSLFPYPPGPAHPRIFSNPIPVPWLPSLHPSFCTSAPLCSVSQFLATIDFPWGSYGCFHFTSLNRHLLSTTSVFFTVCFSLSWACVFTHPVETVRDWFFWVFSLSQSINFPNCWSWCLFLKVWALSG